MSRFFAQLLSLVALFGLSEAFAPSRPVWGRSTTSQTQLEVAPLPLDGSLGLSSSHWLLSTIDGDIAAIPQNEFAPIFAGGILVMFGGLISAVIVGLILEKKDLYASVVADSYAQGADDEAFWKGLSEEEKKKAQEMLNKLKEQSGESKTETPAAVPVAEPAAVVEPVKTTPLATENESKTEPEKELVVAGGESKKADMFSDY